MIVFKSITEVCELNPKKSETSTLNQDLTVSFVGMKDVTEDGLVIPKESSTIKNLYKGFTYFAEGDILFAKITPCMENGKGGIAKDLINNIGFGSTEFHVIRTKKGVSNRYINHLLLAKMLRKQAEANMSGSAGQKRVPKDFFKSYKIPVPPLPIQQKIAAILDEADKLRQLNKQLIAKYAELTQSLFLDMFGDPVTNPKGWEKVSTIQYCECIVPGRDKPKSFTGETPWITTADLNHLSFTSFSRSNTGLSKNEIEQVRARIIPANSVIMTCVGDLGIVSINDQDVVMNQQLHAFICSDLLSNIFLMYNLSFQTPYMHKMASSTTVPYMNKSVANNTPTILPPLELQNQFAERVQVIEAQKAQAQQGLEKAEDLFNSLLQRAFKGELVQE